MKSATFVILTALLFGCCGSIPDSLAGPVVSDECVSVPSLKAATYNISEAELDCYMNKYQLPAYLGTKDYDDCDEIALPPFKAACYGAYAGFLNDSSRCFTMVAQVQKDLCAYTFAINTDDLAACELLSDSELKADCKSTIAGGLPPNNQSGGPMVSDLCVSIPASMFQDYHPTDADIGCYVEQYFIPAVRGEKDYGDCDEIVVGLERSACYGSYCAFLEDSSRCGDFADSWEKDMCLTYFAFGMDDETACAAIQSESLRQQCISDISVD